MHMAKPVGRRTYHDGSFDKFMIDFKLYLNLGLLGKHLVTKRLITDDELTRIHQDPRVTQLAQKIETVINVVRRKGPDAFVEFAGCLQECQSDTPDDGNDTILMKIADELCTDIPEGPQLDGSEGHYTRMLLDVKEELSKNCKIDQVRFCLQRATSISSRLIYCITNYESLVEVLERTHHLHKNDCDVLISLAKGLKCPRVIHIVEAYSRRSSLVAPPLPLQVPMGYSILSSFMDPVMATTSMGRIRQIKNTMRQSTKLLRLSDVNFQGCDAETDGSQSSKILHWRLTEDDSDNLMGEFSKNPKKFHNEGILTLRKMKMVKQLDTSDLECANEDETDSDRILVTLDDAQLVESQNSRDDLTCCICYGLLTDPQQTTCCGHHMCYKCLCKVEKPQCPMCKKGNFKYFEDKSVGRKVKGTKVYCVNKGGGCPWQGERGNLQKHLSIDTLDGECQHQIIRCSYVGCDDKVQRLAMKIHKAQCQYRPIACTDCGLVMSYLLKDKHDPCPKKRIPCSNNGCKASISQVELFQHLITCEYHVMDCPIAGCSERVIKKDLKKHMEANVVIHQLTMNDKLKVIEENHNKEMQLVREGLTKELEGKMAVLRTELSDKLVKLQGDIERMTVQQQQLNHSVSDMRQSEHFICGLMEIADKVKEENWRLYLHTIAEFSTQLQSAQPVIVSLQNYSTKLEKSSKPGGVSFRTTQFYSKRGYRMYLNINPSSQGVHKDRYLAVFVNITKGPNDDQLVWPYDGKVKIKLLNQLFNNDHHTYRKEFYLSSDNDVEAPCIAKPLSDRSNPGWGFTDFIFSENLKKSEATPQIQYLVNDSLYFEVHAD